MDQIYFVMFLTAAFLAAGTIKGAAGLGLPTTALGIMTLSIAPRTAIALLMLPLIFTNAWQVYRSGQIRAAVKHYMPMIVTLVLFVWLTVNLTRSANDTVLLTFLGVSILLFVAVNVTKYAPFIPERWDSMAQIVAGVMAGIMGGLTSVWAPPLAMYLAARRIPKDGFVRASGLIFFLGSIPLAFGYIRQGFMTTELTLMSAYLLIPTFVGFRLGETLRHRMSEQVFRTFVLCVFFVMGLNLIRRAYFG